MITLKVHCQDQDEACVRLRKLLDNVQISKGKRSTLHVEIPCGDPTALTAALSHVVSIRIYKILISWEVLQPGFASSGSNMLIYTE